MRTRRSKARKPAEPTPPPIIPLGLKADILTNIGDLKAIARAIYEHSLNLDVKEIAVAVKQELICTLPDSQQDALEYQKGFIPQEIQPIRDKANQALSQRFKYIYNHWQDICEMLDAEDIQIITLPSSGEDGEEQHSPRTSAEAERKRKLMAFSNAAPIGISDDERASRGMLPRQSSRPSTTQASEPEDSETQAPLSTASTVKTVTLNFGGEEGSRRRGNRRPSAAERMLDPEGVQREDEEEEKQEQVNQALKHVSLATKFFGSFFWSPVAFALNMIPGVCSFQPRTRGEKMVKMLLIFSIILVIALGAALWCYNKFVVEPEMERLRHYEELHKAELETKRKLEELRLQHEIERNRSRWGRWSFKFP